MGVSDMYFQTLGALLYMDGHGVFVWSAYLIAVVVIGAMLLVPGRRRRGCLAQLRGELRRQQLDPAATAEETGCTR